MLSKYAAKRSNYQVTHCKNTSEGDRYVIIIEKNYPEAFPIHSHRSFSILSHRTQKEVDLYLAEGIHAGFRIEMFWKLKSIETIRKKV
jgi:hypothetical protein